MKFLKKCILNDLNPTIEYQYYARLTYLGAIHRFLPNKPDNIWAIVHYFN